MAGEDSIYVILFSYLPWAVELERARESEGRMSERASEGASKRASEERASEGERARGDERERRSKIGIGISQASRVPET